MPRQYTAIPTVTIKLGGADVTFPYRRAVVEQIKYRIPTDYRAWNPETKRWWVGDPYTRIVIDLLRSVFDDVEIIDVGSRSWGYRPDPTPIRPADADYRTLHLLPSAPPELVTAAYRCLARLHHPDTGGDTASMQTVNAAYERLKARVSA